ncbi:ABC transporter ATP-binding protein [Turicibacter sanguinis]|jgi:ferrichrome ABC transporter, ATP-binding protein FhuC|uniref:ABC transporter ATP-binding protein n=1 Tax=Turicibacter sanguinis TaxID=154288 RepID=UPI0012BD73A4|nr:ABC transporter ATP-binding protein [Turicibacter sanguinis]MDB8555794.1 ABC transporter ATP-binding protein [Turicibacter sanguinis]MDB8558278.1 ABC transporter ATP-binding protein [Turicibacter sanguinis]MDB8561162.1 ABC transporter ATP-binding protein [Turicibacter sanguinis]MTN80532.1 ATP-binding cassette domain-containing protein [Turicibacter sanguinis]MTN83742.1 ATP-binding cassette domain-containing protein [Turicibacter sanguinis]
MDAIEVKDLDVAYEQKYIIKNMNLEIPKGKITMIIGSNGCGKSTLLKTIARIITPKKGEIKLDGVSLKAQAPKEIAKKMAVLPQSPIVPSGLLVKELVSYGRFPYQSAMGGLKEKDIEMVNWAMKVTGIAEFSERSVDSLSGGQRQRAWIAMALAQETEILVLDEPTTYLDMAHQLEILMLLQKLNKEENRTIVMVLHELNNATKFADYLIGVKEGEVVFRGKPLDVITNENLSTLYGIDAKLQLDETGQYPICVDFSIK